MPQINAPEIGKWWFYFSIKPDYLSRYRGWRRLDLAVIKLHSLPAEGYHIHKEHYRGIWIRFYFWLPFEWAS